MTSISSLASQTALTALESKTQQIRRADAGRELDSGAKRVGRSESGEAFRSAILSALGAAGLDITGAVTGARPAAAGSQASETGLAHSSTTSNAHASDASQAIGKLLHDLFAAIKSASGGAKGVEPPEGPLPVGAPVRATGVLEVDPTANPISTAVANAASSVVGAVASAATDAAVAAASSSGVAALAATATGAALSALTSDSAKSSIGGNDAVGRAYGNHRHGRAGILESDAASGLQNLIKELAGAANADGTLSATGAIGSALTKLQSDFANVVTALGQSATASSATGAPTLQGFLQNLLTQTQASSGSAPAGVLLNKTV